MPGLDGTGPMGSGPMTGGGRGFCNPYYAGMKPFTQGYPYVSPWGWWGRFPFRTYWRNWPAAGYWPPIGSYYAPGPLTFGGWGSFAAPYRSSAEETQFLKDMAAMMRRDLEEIESQIREKEWTGSPGDLTTPD